MSRPIATVPTPWTTVLLICRKCSRKLDGGFGPDSDDTLRSALRVALKTAGRGRRCRIIETRCFAVCPKKAVTTLNASAPGKLVIVPAGTDPLAALARLAPGQSGAA